MLRDEFTRCLLSELWLQGQPFERWAVEAFVMSAWPAIEEDPAIALWLSLRHRARETVSELLLHVG